MSHGLRIAVLALQIMAPKCAVCWTSYAGLLGASWFAASRYNPGWYAAALCVTAMSLWLAWREARRTRHYVAACAIVPGWLLMLVGAFIGIDGIRWSGVAWVGVAALLPYRKNIGYRWGVR